MNRKYTLIISGDIEQAAMAFHKRDIRAVIEKAYYVQKEHKTALMVRPAVEGRPATVEEDEFLREQMEMWKAERGTTGCLLFYSPYWGKTHARA